MSHEQVSELLIERVDLMENFQALGQCRLFIEKHLPHASLKKMPSTSAAAKALLSSPLTCAAICSKACLTVFNGLDMLNEGIQDQHCLKSLSFHQFAFH